MPRLLHTADWQIGRQYGQFDPEDGALLADARFDTVARIAALATTRQVDAVLVAGDVFDTQTVSERSIRRLFGAMAGYRGPWVLIAGNHDARLADSVWTRAARLGCVPPNVHQPDGVLALPEAGIAVLAAPLTQRHTYDDVTAGFDHLATPPGLLRVGLAHGSVSGRLPEDIDSANPIAPDRAARAALDYLALGDWHGCLQIDARTWYAGTPEPERFRANEPGHVLEVEIDAPAADPVVTRHAVGRYVWTAWQVRLEVPADVDALAARLTTLASHHVLSLAVSGHASLATRARLDEAVGAAAARVRAIRLDTSELALEPDTDDIAALGARGYVAELFDELRALQQDPAQAKVARDALTLLARFQRDADTAGQA